jgi:hypothetical protein
MGDCVGQKLVYRTFGTFQLGTFHAWYLNMPFDKPLCRQVVIVAVNAANIGDGSPSSRSRKSRAAATEKPARRFLAAATPAPGPELPSTGIAVAALAEFPTSVTATVAQDVVSTDPAGRCGAIHVRPESI